MRRIPLTSRGLESTSNGTASSKGSTEHKEEQPSSDADAAESLFFKEPFLNSGQSYLF